MKEALKKIWNDNVWGDIISASIIGIVAYIFYLIGKYYLNDRQELILIEGFSKIYNIKISIIYIPVILVANWIFFWLFKKIFNNQKPLYNKKQMELMEFNSSDEPKSGFAFKWEVHFDNEKPFISDLTAFCTKHKIPFKLLHGRCVIPKCKNSNYSINLFGFKTLIESELIDKWDKLK